MRLGIRRNHGLFWAGWDGTGTWRPTTVCLLSLEMIRTFQNGPTFPTFPDMLLILFDWFFIAYVSFMFGFATRRLFVATSEKPELAMTILWGLFIISVISTILLFFIPAGLFLLTAFFAVAIVIHVGYRHAVRRSLHVFRMAVSNRSQVAFGCVLLFCLLVFSAQASKINDDGYYYIQTMMWFSEVGFVRGISNLMLPIGLGSSWHVLQALFSFDFVEGIRFNDLNGLLIFLFFIFCTENGFHKKENGFLALLVALVVGVSVPFLSAPSPDLPLIVLTAIAFYVVVNRIDSRTTADVLILAAFAITIKISAVALALLGIIVWLYALIQRISIPRGLYLILFFTAIVHFGKNIYQTGYPLYPYHWLGVESLSWTTPADLLEYYSAEIKSWGLEEKIYHGPLSEWHNPGIFETIQLLWERPGYKGVLNKVILATFPLIILTLIIDLYRRSRQKARQVLFAFLHGIFVVNFLIWLILAPQYRFILPVYIFYSVYVVWWWLKKPVTGMVGNKIRWVSHLSIACLLFLSLYPVNIQVNATSTYIGRIDAFTSEIAVKPHVSYFFAVLDTLVVGGQNYYHVKGNSYCWDTPLPCMSMRYYDFVKRLGYQIDRADKECFLFVEPGD